MAGLSRASAPVPSNVEPRVRYNSDEQRLGDGPLSGEKFPMLQFALLVVLVVAPVMAQHTSRVYQSTDRPLALIGDRYHSPVHIRDGLAPAFLRENVPIVFLENEKALTAGALRDFDLLVMFRDGMIWPNGYDQPHILWMTEEHQQAIWDFVNNGGGF